MLFYFSVFLVSAFFCLLFHLSALLFFSNSIVCCFIVGSSIFLFSYHLLTIVQYSTCLLFYVSACPSMCLPVLLFVCSSTSTLVLLLPAGAGRGGRSVRCQNVAITDLRDRGKETWASEVKPRQDRLESASCANQIAPPTRCLVSIASGLSALAPLTLWMVG